MNSQIKNPFGILNSYQPAPVMARPLGVRGHQKSSTPTPSVTMGRGLFVETPLERSALLALDVDPRTTHIAPQPFTVRLDIPAVFSDRSAAMRAAPPLKDAYETAGGLELIYTPDFEVMDGGQVPLVVEVKQSNELKALEGVLKRRGVILGTLGYRFLVVSDEEVGYKGLDRNLVFVRDAIRFLRHQEAQSHLEAIGRAIAGFDAPFPLRAIRAAVSDTAIHLGLATGVIAFDLRTGALSTDTIVKPAHGDLQHRQLLKLGV